MIYRIPHCPCCEETWEVNKYHYGNTIDSIYYDTNNFSLIFEKTNNLCVRKHICLSCNLTINELFHVINEKKFVKELKKIEKEKLSIKTLNVECGYMINKTIYGHNITINELKHYVINHIESELEEE